MADKDWIQDFGTPYYALAYQVKEVLLEEQSKYQNIKIINSYQFGKMLLLDDIVQLSEKDEFIYHEMLVHVPILSHPDPARIYIVGGGDCCSLREVLYHPVRKVVLNDLDEEVVLACRKHLDFLHNDGFSDSRVKLVFGEASVQLQKTDQPYDIIIVDGTDPIGEGVKLFTSQFYQIVAEVLDRDGLIVTQSGSPIFQPNILRTIVENMKTAFPIVQTYTAVVPTYPGVYWSFTMGSKGIKPDIIEIDELNRKITDRGLTFKYYNPEIHHTSFVLPEFVKRILSDKLDYGIFDSPEQVWEEQKTLCSF